MSYSLFVDYRVQLESLPSVYGQLSHTPKSLKRLYFTSKHSFNDIAEWSYESEENR
jgi:hypothetical protein